MEIEILVNEQLKKLVDKLIKEKSTEIQGAKMVPIDLKLNDNSNEIGNSLFTISVNQKSGCKVKKNERDFNEMFDKRFDDRKYEIYKKIIVGVKKLAERLAETGDANQTASELNDLLDRLD